MHMLAWVALGGLFGWAASLIMRTDAQRGTLLNLVVGLAGALLAGWLIAPFIGAAAIRQADVGVGSLLPSLVGAVMLLAVLDLVRGAMREQAQLRSGPPDPRSG